MLARNCKATSILIHNCVSRFCVIFVIIFSTISCEVHSAGGGMAASAFLSAVLCLLLRLAVPMCVPTEYTLYVEKHECDFCVAINTTICMGFCYSRVRARIQVTCVYL